MPLTRRYDPTPEGLAALEPRPMTPEQIDDLVERAQASTTQSAIDIGRHNRARWDRWRAAKGR